MLCTLQFHDILTGTSVPRSLTTRRAISRPSRPRAEAALARAARR
jgi:hypothetical protein